MCLFYGVLIFVFHSQMKTPAIQNDFSYYRRTVNRMRMCRDQSDQSLPRVPDVSCEVANRMSLFYARATPMLLVLVEATSRFVQEVCCFFWQVNKMFNLFYMCGLTV